MGGNRNCCIDFTLDRTGEVPNLQSSSLLFQVFKKADLVDVWRMKHPSVRQYSWVKISEGRLSSARLDGLYVSGSFIDRIFNCQIFSVAFTDHHLFFMEITLTYFIKPTSFGHFNVKL